MSKAWPRLDVHTHVDPSINPTNLLTLRSVVFSATRSLEEFESTLGRNDPVAVWGVGVHPSVPTAIASFSVSDFSRLIQHSPLVSEVGLDGYSPVPIQEQKVVFREVLKTLQKHPRVLSVHSRKATAEVLQLLESYPTKGVVLHWWRGTPTETRRAVDLDCYFSINRGELRRPLVLNRVPQGRILTETDHPLADRAASTPGDVVAVEGYLADYWSTSVDAVRQILWANLASLVHRNRTLPLFPEKVRNVLLAVYGLGLDDGEAMSSRLG